ncbi:cell envelope biogenesis protein OmpA [Allorhizobium terrae]|uniref:cell envelope biogenesis protein OmpA n=1 Tax=Allorhizobium terrae TaxID=1848972 RepID=UPI00167F08F0|nr:cell envelope biogenesis protein OmpA [Allorhizobium terrae]
MFNTAFTFGLTQFARSLSLPERLQKRPLRNAALEPWRFRNASLDAMFYDIKTVTSDEAFYISDSIAAEGMLMIVPPSGQGMLIMCDSIDEYILRGGRDVHVMAVAGIGGSATGAAAFARNIADAVDAPVAAVVSGYGLGDMISEALGSNFLFGPLGFLRHNFEMIDDLVGRPKLGAFKRNGTADGAPRKSSLDTDTVEALLANDKLDFQLVTGHSKGNLIIAEALRALETNAPERLQALSKSLKLISFSTRISVPAAIEPPLAIMGEMDWYGELNATAPATNIIRVPRSSHSTNSDMPGALKVTSLLRDVLNETQTQKAETEPTSKVPPQDQASGLHLVETPTPEPDSTDVASKMPEVSLADEAVVEAADVKVAAPDEMPAVTTEAEPVKEPEAEKTAPAVTAPPTEPLTESVEQAVAEATETVVAEQKADAKSAAPQSAQKKPSAPMKTRRQSRSSQRNNQKP